MLKTFGFLRAPATGEGGGLAVESAPISAYNNTQGKQISVTASSGDLLMAWSLNGVAASSVFTPSDGALTFTQQFDGEASQMHTATATGNTTVTFNSNQPTWGDTYICGVLVISGHSGVGTPATSTGWAADAVSLTPTSGNLVFLMSAANSGGVIATPFWVGTGTINHITAQRTSEIGCGYCSAVTGGANDYGPNMSAAASMEVFGIEVLAA